MKEQFWLERWQRQLRSDKAQYGSSVFHASADCLFSSGPTWSLPKDCLMFSMRESSSLNNRLSGRLFLILRYRSAHGGDILTWRTRTFSEETIKKYNFRDFPGSMMHSWYIYIHSEHYPSVIGANMPPFIMVALDLSLVYLLRHRPKWLTNELATGKLEACRGVLLPAASSLMPPCCSAATSKDRGALTQVWVRWMWIHTGVIWLPALLLSWFVSNVVNEAIPVRLTLIDLFIFVQRHVNLPTGKPVEQWLCLIFGNREDSSASGLRVQRVGGGVNQLNREP